MHLTTQTLRWMGIVAVAICYALLANYTNQSTQNGTLGTLVAIAPIVLATALLAWRSQQPVLILVMAAFASVLLWLAWPLLKQHYGWIYWLEHESLQLILFTTFARTLLANRQPLCTQFAEIIHGTLSPAQIRYTSKATIGWTLFFAAMILTSTGLFFIYPIRVWSIFSNFIFLPLVALMFIVEFIIRKWALPDEAHASIMDAVRTYLSSSRRQR